MYINDLKDIIKPDNESQALYEKLKTKFEIQAKEVLKRARITAIMMGVATIISILFLLYAFEVKSQSEKEINKLKSEIHMLKDDLSACKGH